MASHSRRRRHFRFPAKNVVANGGQLEGELLNVARTGLALETSKPVGIGREYRFSVRYGNACFIATGRVRWCVLRRTRRIEVGEVEPVFHAGLSLEEWEREAQERLLNKLRRQLLTRQPL